MKNIDYRELVREALISIKKYLKFKELETLLELQAPTLWRYMRGEVRPSEERALQLLQKLVGKEATEMIWSKISYSKSSDLVDLYSIAYNVDILTLAHIDALIWMRGLDPTAIVTVEVDGIPLATLIAQKLGVKLAVIKKKKEIGYERFYEASFVVPGVPEVVTMYLPEGTLDRSDRVVIVDDLIRTGRTTKVVIELIGKAGAKVVGLYALLAVGDRWKSVIEPLIGKNYKVFFEVAA